MTVLSTGFQEKRVAIKKSLISIDLIRAIAALGVFFYHQHIGFLLVRATGVEYFGLIDVFGADYAVPLFFLISGYCIHLSNIKSINKSQNQSLLAYYKRRIIRIYPPYLVALILSIVFNYIVNKNLPTLTDFITHIFVLQGFFAQYFNTINLVLWTITIELAFYALYPLFYFMRLKYGLKPAMVTVLIVSGVSIFCISMQSAISLPQYYFILNLWFSWCCGAYLAEFNIAEVKNLFNKKHLILYSAVIILFIILSRWPNPKLSIIIYQLKILLWTLPVAFIVAKEQWFRNIKSWLLTIIKCIGLSSYSLYLLHVPLINIKNYIVFISLPAPMRQAGMLIGFMLIPLATWGCYLLFEKPFIHRSK